MEHAFPVALRETLIQGYRWLLVDEYQDIGPEEYALIGAVAGRSLEDGLRISLFAVGDDDQNIYAFDGASVEFIRRFEADYAAKPVYLIENYRSTAHIIAAANRIIEPARARMKVGHPITIDRARSKDLHGGDWRRLDSIGQGRVQILPVGDDRLTQAVAVMAELQRLSELTPDWNWANAAVIARKWDFLEPVRGYCELHGIPVQMADEEAPNFWRLRETQALVEWLKTRESQLIDSEILKKWLDGKGSGGWWALLQEAVNDYALETGGAETPHVHFTEWLAEWGREVRRRQTGLLLLTAHRAKGLEFDHVAVLDGGWSQRGRNEDWDAPRRLYYVAMTRAKQTLSLARFSARHALLDRLPESPELFRRSRSSLPPPSPALARIRQRLTLKDVYIGFAGRYPASHRVHRAISALNAGDALYCPQEGERRLLSDRNGDQVGQLAKAYAPPPNMRCIAARVAAIIVRRKSDDESAHRDSMRCDQWEIVVPELVFEP